MKVQGIFLSRISDFHFWVSLSGWSQIFSLLAVRKVKTTLDPPTGCSISSLSLRAPTIKLGNIRYHLTSFQLTLASRWHALRKLRVAPRLPANGSFSRQSLAYVHAGTRYIKQVSGLLKIGVTSLRNSSSSYEVVQGMSFRFPSSVIQNVGSCLTAFIHPSRGLGLWCTFLYYVKMPTSYGFAMSSILWGIWFCSWIIDC